MNAIVRPAGSQDAEAICTLLHDKMNDRIPLERWRRLMNYSWLQDKPDFGRVVDADGAILGYCGMVYVDRIIGSPASARRPERMVSMSSWYLDKSLRGKGLGKKMLIECTGDSSLTYATLTNSSKPLAIVESCGFKVLEDHRYLWRKSGAADPALSVIHDRETITGRVDAVEHKLLEDMAELPLLPLLISADGRQSLLFLSVKRKDAGISWHDLMYASDLDVFSSQAQALANTLLQDETSVLAADARFVSGVPTGAERVPLPVPRYFKSQRVLPHELDHLYSELQLLDLKLD